MSPFHFLGAGAFLSFVVQRAVLKGMSNCYIVYHIEVLPLAFSDVFGCVLSPNKQITHTLAQRALFQLPLYLGFPLNGE